MRYVTFYMSICAAFCCQFLSIPLFAQQQKVDTTHTYFIPEVTVSDIYQTREVRSTAPLQLFSKEALKNLHALQVSDAVKHFAGVTVKDYGGIGGLKTVSIRSLGAQHTVVGYDGIAITNHFFPRPEIPDFLDIYRSDYLKALETGDKLGMKVYLGAELRFPSQNDNDYLLFDFELSQLEEMYSYMTGTLENFVENFKTNDMFLLQAHPFRDGMELGFENYLDGVEVFNMHPNHNSRVALAEKYAREHGKIATAGTDYHHIGHDNLCATRAPYLPGNEHELVSLLQSNDFVFQVGEHFIV